MKKTLLYSAMALAATMTMSSCGDDFLLLEPVGVVTESTLMDAQGVDYVLTKAYANLYAPGRDYFSCPLVNYTYGDCFGGDANKGSEFADQSDFTEIETYSFNSANGYIRSKYRYVYDGVKYANDAERIANMTAEAGKITEAELTRVKAQTAFLRGLFHFEAVKLFGAAVPYVSYEASISATDPKVSNVDENGNYIFIWDNILADFDYAMNNLPETWPSNQVGRVNKWAAAAYKAKVLIYQASPYTGAENGAGKTGNWAAAKSILEQIINSGVDSKGQKFRLADTYEELWTAGKSDWTGESVFDIQATIVGTSNNNPSALLGGSHIAMAGAIGGGWGFFQPSVYLTSSMKTDANGLPVEDLGGTLSVPDPKGKPDIDPKTGEQKKDDDGNLLWKEIIKTDLDVYTDPRLDYAVGRFGVPYYDWGTPETVDGWVRSTSNGGYYLNKKYMPKKADKGSLSNTNSTGSTAKNHHLIRFADILLFYAECCIETGDNATALEYINKVRARAANSYVKADATTLGGPYVLEDLVNGTVKEGAAGNYRIGLWPAGTDARKALIAERHMELALEGHRWFDLARWGIAQSTVQDFINYESGFLAKYQGKTYNPKWVMFPIPNDEIVTMQGLLVQNSAWK
ncbi:MAG: RagB/SusD family nutrient uptake outer membrane protein [Bacteroidaceae bacterium]|nr:RagB/SusD family nutrient uptake outer membrane protein [Bacteroidaceae bacterium]MBQ7553598.1 RagB/SusD family nutrient uptake outer membrane protein [Bacteroidaceae bacterium]